ncbi:DUF1499 domain-containing protein [Wenzhouxiangella sp. XN201]|uniref:DUF1499 domain-containing protein n=1 Tax=Wenzhouxiangella sp. XN201 TaxID=2710755 RepID=UPI0013C5BB10|nr:DUF1499 domain-containing protein [Wenzhouxiangella sp. XN201]NEZ05055.1 DUF1499 domain-containing protein [Wenzhouxiangella sp. XN201]
MQFFRLFVLVLAVLAALALLVAGPGTRLELWDFRFGFTLMRWALYGGLAAAGLAVIVLLIPGERRAGVMGPIAAIVIGLVTAAIPYLQVQKARSVPPIHDISTDTVDPPEFVAIAPLRADAPNPPEYAGQETAQQQREAYPDIQTLEVDSWPTLVFEDALETARAQGWEIVEASESEGRIEATATTLWFGFKDDVVIRIRGDNDGSVIDVRSKSRVGRSDVGANAARIQAYLDKLTERLQ